MAAQWTEHGGERARVFGGVWAIFGHGNVAALGEALYAAREVLPTFRAHNEQAMGHAAVAYAKASQRRRMMACTTSIGPGATNLVTAAAVAHVNRLPLLLLPGDVFATRLPDPVLQQVEDFGDGLITANDCLRPVSRYFDRITRPEQLLNAFQRAMQVLTDPADCGPVTLALCQDVQAQACDWPASFFEERTWIARRPPPDARELGEAARVVRAARRPLLVCGGGVVYSDAGEALAAFCERHGIPSAETQAGKSALPAGHALNLGGIGVTGTAAANTMAAEADLILAVGTRLSDFTTGSRALFQGKGRRIVALNVQPFDAGKQGALPLVADAREGLTRLSEALERWRAPREWTERALGARGVWLRTAAAFTAAADSAALPTDAQVIGAVQRAARASDVVVCAAGGLPGELHRHWQAGQPGGYHLEYGYSCMGYEIAGGLGVKMADPSRDVYVMVGDASYLMMSSEIITSIQEGYKLNIVIVDNHGFSSIGGLSQSVGSGGFGTDYRFRNGRTGQLDGEHLPVDFVRLAAGLGAIAVRATTLKDVEDSLEAMRSHDRTSVVVVETDKETRVPGYESWWDVPISETSDIESIRYARARYDDAMKRERHHEIAVPLDRVGV
jgi:3D-(3,5/4)-trihydroxycyclohexane-1,2-dione acylhydrolase (decyclizing)